MISLIWICIMFFFQCSSWKLISLSNGRAVQSLLNQVHCQYRFAHFRTFSTGPVDVCEVQIMECISLKLSFVAYLDLSFYFCSFANMIVWGGYFCCNLMQLYLHTQNYISSVNCSRRNLFKLYAHILHCNHMG